MVEIKAISYEDERLEFFKRLQQAVQKRYDRLEKTIDPDEPYLSERRELLSDCGRELSFYNDVIEMLEADVVPKSEVDKLYEVIFKKEDLMQMIAKERNDYYDELQNAKQEVAREIFKNIDGITDLFAKGIITELEMYDMFANNKKKYTK